jgi:T5orf172 domain
MDEFQTVYVLTNSAMPGLVKIGFTSRNEVSKRMLELYGSGVPVPFTLEFACRVKNATEVERALHLAFGPNRFNPKREFFSIQPEQAIAILKLLHTEETTNEVRAQPSGLDAQDLDAAEHLRRRRPNLNFSEMKIPEGAELRSANDDSVATVIGPRKVLFHGEETSLTAATKRVLDVEYAVNPGPHWTYNGRTISEIYNETYESPEE